MDTGFPKLKAKGQEDLVILVAQLCLTDVSVTLCIFTIRKFISGREQAVCFQHCSRDGSVKNTGTNSTSWLKLILEKIDKGHSDDREGESAINIYFCLAKVLFFIWCNELINGQEIFIFIYLLIYIFIYLCIYICIYLCNYIFMYLRRDGC